MLTDIPCNICRAEDKSALIYLTCLCLHRPLAKVQQKTRKAPFFNHRDCRDGKKDFPGLRELRRCYHATLEKLLSNFSVLLLRSSLEIDEASDLRTLEVRKGVWGREGDGNRSRDGFSSGKFWRNGGSGAEGNFIYVFVDWCRYVKKIQRIGSVIPRCKLQCMITQPILRMF